MANPIVTPAMFGIMRAALGLGVFTKRPTTNHVILAGRGGQADPELVEKMIDMELLTRVERHGPHGKEPHIMVSDEGMRLTVDEQAEFHKLADVVKEEHKRQHEAEFGLRKKYPYIPNGARIHEDTIKRMAEIEAE